MFAGGDRGLALDLEPLQAEEVVAIDRPTLSVTLLRILRVRAEGSRILRVPAIEPAGERRVAGYGYAAATYPQPVLLPQLEQV